MSLVSSNLMTGRVRSCGQGKRGAHVATQSNVEVYVEWQMN